MIPSNGSAPNLAVWLTIRPKNVFGPAIPPMETVSNPKAYVSVYSSPATGTVSTPVANVIVLVSFPPLTNVELTAGSKRC
jgi:hypothetical protein